MSKPRVGFLGTGWIGRHRMQAIVETGAIEVAGLADPSPECVAEALKLVAGIGASLAGQLLMLDARNMEWRAIKVARNPHCPVCAA